MFVLFYLIQNGLYLLVENSTRFEVPNPSKDHSPVFFPSKSFSIHIENPPNITLSKGRLLVPAYVVEAQVAGVRKGAEEYVSREEKSSRTVFGW